MKCSADQIEDSSAWRKISRSIRPSRESAFGLEPGVEVGQDPAIARDQGIPGRRREVVEPVVEAMVAQPGGVERLEPEAVLEVAPEEGFEAGILGARALRPESPADRQPEGQEPADPADSHRSFPLFRCRAAPSQPVRIELEQIGAVK